MEQRFADTRTVSKKFEDWAKGLSGIPGGNPEGELWFCGIEYGGGTKEVEFGIPDTDKSLSKYPFWTQEFKDANKNEYTTWQFNQKQAKIAVAYLRDGSLDDWHEYMREKFYTHNGHTFGMNLYPLSFHDTDDKWWTSQHYEKIGLLSKAEYKGWCSQHRFPKLRELVVKHSPKALVCTGNGFKRAFLIAFADTVEQLFDKNGFQKEDVGKRKKPKYVEWTRINNGKTLLVITPFLGPGGLMSDASLVDLGSLIRREVRQ